MGLVSQQVSIEHLVCTRPSPRYRAHVTNAADIVRALMEPTFIIFNDLFASMMLALTPGQPQQVNQHPGKIRDGVISLCGGSGTQRGGLPRSAAARSPWVGRGGVRARALCAG